MVYINYVANLATQNPTTDNEVYVQAYATFGDCGGGYFVWRTSAELPTGAIANNGIWFSYSGGGGLWERQFSIGGPINVKWFGAKGDGVTEDTLSITNTLSVASQYGFSVFIPKGTYLVNQVFLTSNIEIFGEGDLSILQTLYKNQIPETDFIFYVNSSSGNNIQNVRIKDLKFNSSVATLSQYKHFLSLSGVSNFIIENCLFQQFRGDGIYLGSSTGVHNDNVTIRNCRFDGGSARANRNAISVIDGTMIIIENNNFQNTTDSTMPGAIDIEPGSGDEILKDIIVQNNYFYNIGGSVACCAVVLPGSGSNPNLTVTPSGFYFRNNYMENVFSGFWFENQYVPSGGIDTKPKTPYYVEDNIVIPLEYAFSLYGACHAKITGNYFSAPYGALVGFSSINSIATDILITENYFDKCGSYSVSGTGLIIFNCKRVKILSNIFNDCGAHSGGTGVGNAIDFNGTMSAPATSDYVDIQDNIFLSPTGKTTIAIQKEAYHTFSPRNNRFLNNQYTGLTNYFQWINDNNFGHATGMSPSNPIHIVHSMGATPKWATVQAASSSVPAIAYITVDSTYIYVYLTTTPGSLTDFYWVVQI